MSDERPVICLGAGQLTIEDALLVADGGARVELSGDSAYRALLNRGPEMLRERLDAGRPVYGVTTGFGESCTTDVPPEFAVQLPGNLVRYHGCGTGPLLKPGESAAVLVLRAAALALGFSGVRPKVIETLLELLNNRIIPCIPRHGSVGASGDLTPLSYVAAALMGEREVHWRGAVYPAGDALAACGIEGLPLAPKESLALMNGTTVMAALACVAFRRSATLARLACAITAMASDVTRGNPDHFNDRIFELKPHPGMRQAARWIRSDICESLADPASGRIQDRYSIRCAPHVIGVLLDALPWIRRIVETEINGANDNPLIDPLTDQVLHGGNFYGGHLCFALDALKAAVANIADLLERQLLLACSPVTSNGLPTDLVAVTGPGAAVHHGFKAMQITASALTAEALKLTMPASVFSRSTENHNQDKVSMGTIAAHDCLEVLSLTETVAAIALLAMCQAVDLRKAEHCGRRALTLHARIRSVVPVNSGDRRQDGDIAAVLDMLEHRRLPYGDIDMMLEAAGR